MVEFVFGLIKNKMKQAVYKNEEEFLNCLIKAISGITKE
jgi:hypothetical protein